MFAFGLIGYLTKKLDYPQAPLVLALVLGKRVEVALRQSLKMSEADVSILFTRPISGVIMIAVIIIFLWPLLNRFLWKPLFGKSKA